MFCGKFGKKVAKVLLCHLKDQLYVFQLLLLSVSFVVDLVCDCFCIWFNSLSVPRLLPTGPNRWVNISLWAKKEKATWTRLGGKQFVSKSRRVSVVVVFLPSLWCSSSSVLARPGLKRWFVISLVEQALARAITWWWWWAGSQEWQPSVWLSCSSKPPSAQPMFHKWWWCWWWWYHDGDDDGEVNLKSCHVVANSAQPIAIDISSTRQKKSDSSNRTGFLSAQMRQWDVTFTFHYSSTYVTVGQMILFRVSCKLVSFIFG